MKWPLFTSPAPEQKVSQGYALHYNGLQPANWTARNYTSFAKEGYQQNVVVASAVKRLSDAIASIEWQVDTGGGTRLDKHPLLDLLDRPNPQQTGAEWFRDRVGYLLLAGNNYDEKVRIGGKVAELWSLRPDRMSIIPSSTGLPRGFEYKVGNRTTSYPADPKTGESPILHTKLFHPTDDWYGLSVVEAAAYGIDQHNEAMTWIQSLLQNSARPSGALVSDSDVGLSEEEFSRLKAELEQHFSGGRNAGRPMLLEGGLDWKAMGLSPMDMEIIKTKDSAARDIALAFGVPPLLLNIPGDNTYSNYREARLGLYEDTVIPLLNYITEEMNNWLSLDFGGARLVPNLDQIEAIADKRKQLWEMADSSQDLTIDERRALKGYPPLPNGEGNKLASANPLQNNAELAKGLAYGDE